MRFIFFITFFLTIHAHASFKFTCNQKDSLTVNSGDSSSAPQTSLTGKASIKNNIITSYSATVTQGQSLESANSLLTTYSKLKKPSMSSFPFVPQNNAAKYEFTVTLDKTGDIESINGTINGKHLTYFKGQKIKDPQVLELYQAAHHNRGVFDLALSCCKDDSSYDCNVPFGNEVDSKKSTSGTK